jgi:GTPase
METVYGNTQSIKSSYIKQLEQLYQQKQPDNRFATSEFSLRLAILSTEMEQPLCVYLNRQGQVVRVAVGTPAQTQLSPSDLPDDDSDSFCGIRCIAAQPDPPDRAALLAMSWQRLDALVVIITVKKEPWRRYWKETDSIKEIYVAHVVPNDETPWVVSQPLSLKKLVAQDFVKLIDKWETKFSTANVGELQSQ